MAEEISKVDKKKDETMKICNDIIGNNMDDGF